LAGASSVSVEDNRVTVRFPALPDKTPPRHYPNLGKEVHAGKNAIWFKTQSEEAWRDKLIHILKLLSENEI
jgi:hypothetical protein